MRMAMAARMLISRGKARSFMTMTQIQHVQRFLAGPDPLGFVDHHHAPIYYVGAAGLQQNTFRSGVSVRELLGFQRSFSVASLAGESAQKPVELEDKSGLIAEKQAGKGSEYWGKTKHPLVREDGSPWPWNSFRPSDTYEADISIDMKRHHKMDSFVDTMAFWAVRGLRIPTDIFPLKNYVYRVMMLETVAAVPGMVGGMLLHLRSLRKFEHGGGWIKALLEEAENERMHLMTWMEVKRPNWFARALVFIVQGGFFNTYFLAYLLSPRLAHRAVGYLEEEAVYSYTKMLAAIDNGIISNGPAPAIAIDYWRLPPNATVRDVVVVIRADEAHHRDVNHFAADVHEQGKVLRDAPAPIDFH
ncbi:hypothetical protein O6H91_17G065300 [Diphasiastrum complanatum]|uniref:Uncharacterized protein n=1 Tax=Diphasiastrum complanatum TaxID=34168 RepID=A0ACC2B7L5_DIPCM|nr:hypothetical protein O6H91_17G065300 [Diphasiastrum complanatum]